MPRTRFPVFLALVLVLVLSAGWFAGTSGAQSPVTQEPANVLTETGRWEWESPTFSDVYALDHDNIFAAGKGFWRSTNGGASWTHVQLYDATAFSAVRFRDPEHGYLLADLALVLTTSDGGATWTRASGRTNANPERSSGEATDEKAVWYAGDQYEVTASGPEYKGSNVNVSLDGGATWSASSWVAPIIRIVGFNQSAWVYYWPDNPDTGCMSGVSYTADGGKNWACTPFYYGGKWVWTIDAAFASATEGWLGGQVKTTGQYGLWRSTDGGRNWLLQRTYTEKVDWVEAFDGQTAWVGLGSHMERTIDGGASWEELPAPPSRPSFTSISRGWSHDDTHVYRTTDGGRSWTAMLTENPKPNAGWFWDHLTGWRVAGDRIERTTDGGNTWLGSTAGLPAVDDFHFVDPRHGWAWNNGTKELRRTTDGGATWAPQTPGTDTLKELQFVDGLTGWVTTSGNQLRRTLDGGQTWEFVASPLLPEEWWTPAGGRAGLDDVVFLNQNDGIALSSYCWQEGGSEACTGGEARTHDGGLSWSFVKVEPKTALFLPDGKNGWGWVAGRRMDGDYFEVTHTSDAAASWKLARAYSSWFGPNWLAARDGHQAWNGADDLFYASVNDGASWTAQRSQGRPETAPSVDRLGNARIRNGLFHRNTEVRAVRALKAPNLDGLLQDWANVPAYSFKAGDAVSIEGSAPLVFDSSMTLRSAWDANTLYFALQVYDDAIVVDSGAKPWQDDSVELGLDGYHDHIRKWDAGADQDDRQFTVDANGGRYESGAAFDGYSVAKGTWEHGYVIEVAIPRTLLGPQALKTGRLIGFNFGLHDDDDGGNWESRLTWLDKDTYKANAAWGQIRLLSDGQPFDDFTPTPTATASLTPSATATPTATTTPSATPTATSTPRESQRTWLPLILGQ